MPSSIPTATPTHIPSAIEQEHIRQALDASQTAIDAIGTVVSVSSYALGIIGIAVALIAFWGWSAIRDGSREVAERIANTRFDSYVGSQEFQMTIQDRIDKAVETKWQDAQMKALRKDDGFGAAGDFPAPPEEE